MSVEHAQGDGRTRGGKEGQEPGAKCRISEGGGLEGHKGGGEDSWMSSKRSKGEPLQTRGRQSVVWRVAMAPTPDPGTPDMEKREAFTSQA